MPAAIRRLGRGARVAGRLVLPLTVGVTLGLLLVGGVALVANGTWSGMALIVPAMLVVFWAMGAER